MYHTSISRIGAHDSVPELLPEWCLRSVILSRHCDLSSSARLVVLAVLEYCQPGGPRTFPSQAVLATATGLGERTVRTMMREAMDKAWVLKVGADSYCLVVPADIAARAAEHAAAVAAPIVAAARNDLQRRAADRRNKEEVRRDMARQFGTYYRDRTGRSERFIFDDKRERLVMARLMENGDNLGELLYAVDGMLKSDFHQGRDPRNPGRRHDSIELLCRDRAHVEMFRDLVTGSGEHPYLVGETA